MWRCLVGSTARSTRLGKPSQVLPGRILPAVFLRTPPHCLKKNGTPSALHCSRIERTQASFIGLAPGPLSPPTMTQEMPSNGSEGHLLKYPPVHTIDAILRVFPEEMGTA